MRIVGSLIYWLLVPFARLGQAWSKREAVSWRRAPVASSYWREAVPSAADLASFVRQNSTNEAATPTNWLTRLLLTWSGRYRNQAGGRAADVKQDIPDEIYTLW